MNASGVRGRLIGTVGLAMALVLIGCSSGGAETRPTRSPRQPARSGEPIVTSEPRTLPPGSADVWMELTDFPKGNAFEVTGATVTSEGFVVVGFGGPGEAYDEGPRDGIIWRSADGRSWQRSAEPEFKGVIPDSVVALGDALYVFGTSIDCVVAIDEDCTDALETWTGWRSVAGGAWQRVDQPEDVADGDVEDVVVANGQLVALGTGGKAYEAMLWTSTDGATWRATSDLGGIESLFTAGGASGDRMVVFGDIESEEDEDEYMLAAAVSTDGLHFSPGSVPYLEAATIRQVTDGPSGLVAVGDGEDDEFNDVGIALHSVDGQSWTIAEAADGSFMDAAIDAVHAVGGGYIAIGEFYLSDDTYTATGVSWASTDGRSWHLLAHLGGEFDTFGASAAGPAGIVVFASKEIDTEELETEELNGWFAPAEGLSF